MISLFEQILGPKCNTLVPDPESTGFCFGFLGFFRCEFTACNPGGDIEHSGPLQMLYLCFSFWDPFQLFLAVLIFLQIHHT